MQALSDRTASFTDSVIRRMTRISNQYGAVNLSQGFPDFDPPKPILDRLSQVAYEDYHQYSITWGAQDFREALAKKQSHFMGRDIDPNGEIVVTCGSTEAMMAAMMTVANPGDKVVIFGGGQSGCEAALELVLQGKHPTIVEYAVDLVAAANVPLPNASYLREALVFHKVPIYLESTITNIKDGSVTVKGKDGTITEVECDNVVNAIGFLPTPVAKKGKNVHLVGDCIAIGNLRTVIWRAWDVCMKI